VPLYFATTHTAHEQLSKEDVYSNRHDNAAHNLIAMEMKKIFCDI
jgi:hypothetical protein